MENDKIRIQLTTKLNFGDALTFRLGGTLFVCNEMMGGGPHDFFHWGDRFFGDSGADLLFSFRECLARHQGPLLVEFWRGSHRQRRLQNRLEVTLTGREATITERGFIEIQGVLTKVEHVSENIISEVPFSETCSDTIDRYRVDYEKWNLWAPVEL